MAYNVISCIEVAEITQTLKIAEFTMKSQLRTLKITVYWGRGIASPSIFLIGMSYIGWFHVKAHAQSFQNIHGKGG